MSVASEFWSTTGFRTGTLIVQHIYKINDIAYVEVVISILFTDDAFFFI